MAITNALIKLAGNSASKGIKKASSKAIEGSGSKALTKSLSGAGLSSLAPKAGSTLDGILGRSSGIVLPEPEIVTKSLSQYGQEAMGKGYKSIGDVMDNMDLRLSDIKSSLSKKNYKTLEKGARDVAEAKNATLDAIGIGSKSQLPKLNRNPKDAGEKFARGGNDEILRDLFQDRTSPISDLYAKYEEIAQSGNKGIFTPDNIDEAVAMQGKNGDAITQDFADRAFGNKRGIDVTGGAGKASNIKVSRAKADAGVDKAVAEAPKTTNPELATKIADMREELNSAIGGGAAPPPASPDYGGLGESGFVGRLNTGEPINVVAGNAGTGASKDQIAIRNIRDRTLKNNLNTTKRQYADLIGKSRSYGGHYATIADRIDAENITLANVAQKTEAMLNHIEGIKDDAFTRADSLGLSVNLNGVDNASGLRPFQKKQLSDLGLNLNDIIGDKSVSARQADDIYRILKSYAYDLKGDKDTIRKQAGKVLDKAADTVSKRIDDTMDNMGVDYKKAFLDGADVGGVGADGVYLRKIAESGKEFKFSDLRREESDWINIGKTAGNPLKDEKVPESITEAVGQGFKKGADKAREYMWRKQAGKAGDGITFTEPAGSSSTLGGILGKAKTAGLVGGGMLGGMLLGGGGSSESPTDMSYAMPITEAEEEPMIDPYSTITLNGYTYDDLEAGYMASLEAGDVKAAELIADMIKMLDAKVERYQDMNEKSKEDSSGIAGKQKAAMNVLSGLMTNYSAQGPIGGGFTQFMNMITGGGYNPKTAAYDSGSKGSMGTIIKALGDTGALSEGDQKRALELLPKTTDSKRAAEMKYQQLMQILQGAGAQ